MSQDRPTASPAAASLGLPTCLEVVDQYLRCVREGDREGLRDILSAHLEVRYFGPHGSLPWVGTWRGLRGFERFAKAVVENLEVLEAAEIERIVDDPKVVIVSRARWRVRANSKELRVRMVTIFAAERGRLAEYHVHTDTAAFVAAMAGRDP